MSAPGKPPLLDPARLRHGAVLALHAVLGAGPAEVAHVRDARMGLRLPARGLLLIAGDPQMPLAFGDLLPISREQGSDLIATYADAHKEGHRLLIDLVLTQEGKRRLFAAYRLWLPSSGWPWFVPENGEGLSVAVTRRKLVVTHRTPFHDAIARTAGIARGQGELHRNIYGMPVPAILQERWGHY